MFLRAECGENPTRCRSPELAQDVLWRVIAVCWLVAGVIWIGFGALNYFTHVGLIVNENN